jgi:hypothetical protein
MFANRPEELAAPDGRALFELAVAFVGRVSCCMLCKVSGIVARLLSLRPEISDPVTMTRRIAYFFLRYLLCSEFIRVCKKTTLHAQIGKCTVEFIASDTSRSDFIQYSDLLV